MRTCPDTDRYFNAEAGYLIRRPVPFLITPVFGRILSAAPKSLISGFPANTGGCNP